MASQFVVKSFNLELYETRINHFSSFIYKHMYI